MENNWGDFKYGATYNELLHKPIQDENKNVGNFATKKKFRSKEESEKDQKMIDEYLKTNNTNIFNHKGEKIGERDSDGNYYELEDIEKY